MSSLDLAKDYRLYFDILYTICILVHVYVIFVQYAIPGTMHYDRTAAGNWHAYCDCGRFTARVIDEIAKYA